MTDKSIDLVSNFGARMKERVRAAMLDCIPDEKWDELIKKEITDYFKETPVDSYYRPPIPSPFTVVVKNELEAVVKGKLQALVQSTWGTEFFDNEGPFYKTLMDLVVQKMPEILNGLLAKHLQQVIYSMQQGR